MRECRVCKQEKPLGEFRLLKGRYYTRMCKKCLYTQSVTGPDRPEVKSPRRKRYYIKNKKQEKAGVKAWVENNRQAKASHNRRRINNLLHLPSMKQSDWDEVLEEQGNVCLVCGSTPVTVDHITPICKGGDNRKENLQPLCSPCNASKGTQIVDYRRLPSLNVN